MGSYKIPFENAAKECEANGMVLATMSQLEFAFSIGYEKCACGWLSNKGAYYPTVHPRKGCGNKQKINYCGNDLSKGYDVYCYRDEVNGKLYKNTEIIHQKEQRNKLD